METNEKTIQGRDVVIYFSVKYGGEWAKIYEAMKNREGFEPEAVREMVEHLPLKCVTIIDPEYPERLKRVYKPPFCLFYHGDLTLAYDTEKIIAGIGTEHPTKYGRHITQRLIGGLSKELTLITQLSKGINAEIADIATTVGGKAIVVLPGGIDSIPFGCESLYGQIKETGLLISEYPGNAESTKENSAFAGRIVAALGKALVVTETKKRSSDLITVGYALFLGKDVFCVPNHVGMYSGCNQLIRDGAILVETAEDVLTALGQKAPTKEKTE